MKATISIAGINKLTITSVREGDGQTFPRNGSKVRVHFDAFLTNGVKIESSKENDQPLEFQVGVDDVIDALDIIVRQMSVGQKVKVEIPSSLAYGKNGLSGFVPGFADIIMEVELISITL